MIIEYKVKRKVLVNTSAFALYFSKGHLVLQIMHMWISHLDFLGGFLETKRSNQYIFFAALDNCYIQNCIHLYCI